MSERLLVAFISLLCVTGLCAEPLKTSKATGSIIRTKGKIQTGSSSRIEVELPSLGIVRVGSNADLKFSPDAKKMSLKSGTMLLSIPKKTDGVSVESGSVITALTKGDLEMSNVNGKVKVVTLNGRVAVSLAANPSDRRSLRSGDMVDVPAGATQMPQVTAIRLALLLKTSVLFNMGPLPSGRAIRQNATQQAPPRMPPFVTGGFDPDWGGGGGTFATIGPAGTAAMVALIEQTRTPVLPVLSPGQVPTQAQIVALEAAGKPVPPSNIRAIEQSGASRVVEGERVRPRPVPPPVVVAPPIVRPTPRPPIIVRPRPPIARPPIFQPPIAVP